MEKGWEESCVVVVAGIVTGGVWGGKARDTEVNIDSQSSVGGGYVLEWLMGMYA